MFVLGVLVAVPFSVYYAGSLLITPNMHDVGVPPPDLPTRAITFSGVHGWFVPAKEATACTLLMHGVRSDRRSMLARARFLYEAGFSSLLIDFQAHGESPGDYISFGYLEARNAQSAVALLRTKLNCPKVIAIGQSLGGAAAVLGEHPIDADILVLESVYPTIEEAVSNRLVLRLGIIGPYLTPLLTMQLKPRLGVSPWDLNPVDRISAFHHPVMIMSGTEDKHTPIYEARRLYDAANQPKVFWPVHGASHIDLHRFSPEPYRERLLGFISRHL